ncbi:MAG: hypothetical protein ACJ74Z_01445 [Bryobacteraceae bacterium]
MPAQSVVGSGVYPVERSDHLIHFAFVMQFRNAWGVATTTTNRLHPTMKPVEFMGLKQF